MSDTTQTDHAAAIREHFESLVPHFNLESWEIDVSRDEIMAHVDALAAERDALRRYARAMEDELRALYRNHGYQFPEGNVARFRRDYNVTPAMLGEDD
jgi:hypothetical protein